MPTPLTDADKVLRNDTGKDIATNIAGIASALNPSDIDDLGDVQLTNPITHGQVLTYDNTSQKWVNGIGSVAIQCTQVEYDVWKANNQLKKSTLYVITDGMYLNGTALDLIYSNTTSGLSATNVQNAVDELASEKAEWSQLQDFPTVTPTSSDKLLVVQSQGQGLVSYGDSIGSKMDKANPTGTGSLSLNRKANTTTGNGSVATGYNGTASGVYSVAQGESTVASGAVSLAEGRGTVANSRSQFVFGEFNTADTANGGSSRGNYVEIVGKGTADNARSNARTLDWSGNEVLAGGLKINGSEDVHGTAITTNETFDFTSSTTFSYTGKSISCPSTHLYICSVQLQFSNNQPQEIGIIDNSSSALIYQTVFRSSSQAFATFIIPPSKTYYIWAKYAGAGSNRIIINTVDIKL